MWNQSVFATNVNNIHNMLIPESTTVISTPDKSYLSGTDSGKVGACNMKPPKKKKLKTNYDSSEPQSSPSVPPSVKSDSHSLSDDEEVEVDVKDFDDQENMEPAKKRKLSAMESGTGSVSTGVVNPVTTSSHFYAQAAHPFFVTNSVSHTPYSLMNGSFAGPQAYAAALHYQQQQQAMQNGSTSPSKVNGSRSTDFSINAIIGGASERPSPQPASTAEGATASQQHKGKCWVKG